MELLQKIDENIWIVEGECVDFHGFPYPTRSVIIRLQNDDLWVWSPIVMSDTLRSEILQIGKPKHLVSPNKIHHLYLSDWAAEYPDVKIWGPKSVIHKRKDLAFERALTKEPPNIWANELQHIHIVGSFVMDEILFYHNSSKTLIMADFSENFSKEFLNKNWKPWQRIFAQIAGITVGKGYAPIDWRLTFFKKKALKEAQKRILHLDVKNVIMAHGEWQHKDVNAFLKQSLSWI